MKKTTGQFPSFGSPRIGDLKVLSFYRKLAEILTVYQKQKKKKQRAKTQHFLTYLHDDVEKRVQYEIRHE